MSDIIRIKIDCMKIDKSRLFAGKNGQKYLDATLLPVRDSKYGESHMIVQDVSKEERLSGVKGAILGNAKTLAQRTEQRPPQRKPEPAASPDDDHSVPF